MPPPPQRSRGRTTGLQRFLGSFACWAAPDLAEADGLALAASYLDHQGQHPEPRP